MPCAASPTFRGHGSGSSVPHSSGIPEERRWPLRQLWRLTTPSAPLRLQIHVCQLVAELSPSIQSVFSNPFGATRQPKKTISVMHGCPSWIRARTALGSTSLTPCTTGRIKGFFSWGQNPACSGANANKVRQALAKLDWLVNVNIFDNETGSFWKGPGMDPKSIKTEVFMLPCAASMEKEGSISQQRPLGPVALQGR